MDENLSFNTTKLNEVYEEMLQYYNEYNEIILSLELEIKKLETSWGEKENSVYHTFKEKYEEKKRKLTEMESLMKELIDILDRKKEEIEEATTLSNNNFE